MSPNTNPSGGVRLKGGLGILGGYLRDVRRDATRLIARRALYLAIVGAVALWSYSTAVPTLSYR